MVARCSSQGQALDPRFRGRQDISGTNKSVVPAEEAVRKSGVAEKEELQQGRACFETRPLGAPQHEVIL